MSDPEEAALIAEGSAVAAAARFRPARGIPPTAQPCPRCRQRINHWFIDAYHCMIFEQIQTLWLKGKITHEKWGKVLAKLEEDDQLLEAAARDADTVDYLIRRLNEAEGELSLGDRLDMEHLRLNRTRDFEKASKRNEKLEKALERAHEEDTRAQTLFEATLIIRHFELMEKYGRNAVRARQLIAEFVHLEPEQQQQEEEEEGERRPDPPMKKEEEEDEKDVMGTLASAAQPVVPCQRAGESTRTERPVKKEEEETGTSLGAVQPAAPERRAAGRSRVTRLPVKREEEEEARGSVNAVAPAPTNRSTAGRPERTSRRTSRRTQPYPT